MRSRAEGWRWYDGTPAGEYLFAAAVPRLALFQDRPRVAWRVDATLPSFVGLPPRATLPGAGGQLGMGASYFAGNDSSRAAAGLVLRQAYAEWRSTPAAVRLGRFEFSDGAERAPHLAGMTALKASRLHQRLIGPFVFTHVGRSFDGGTLRLRRGETQLLLLAARPTSGVFTATAAGRTLNVDLVYGALTSGGALGAAGEWDARLFGVNYRDRRGVVPVDSRPVGVRTQDARRVDLQTAGGHIAALRTVGSIRLDGVAWGAWQRGDWGSLQHRAWSMLVEGGVQWPRAPLTPWLRAGSYRGSGDDSAVDREHKTFFQILPTPRPFARFPFYNGMNTDELFGYVTIVPSRTVTARSGINWLRLHSEQDLWYLGGGAFDARAFGFTGRPPAGGRSLGRLADVSVEWRPASWLAMEAFLARNWGNDVAARIYGSTGSGRLAYLEATLTR
jgi:hypothetical protein